MKTKLSLSALFILLAVLVIVSCRKPGIDLTENDNLASVPSLPQQVFNYKNSSNDHSATLGRVLFYDKSLSLNNSVSCASCHQQARAFCDNQSVSTGVEGLKTDRNTPSIFGKNGRVFWDGRAGSMTELVLAPIKNHVEMKFESMEKLAAKLSTIDYYKPLFNKAFPQKARIDSISIRQALADFLMNFDFSANKFTLSRANRATLTASETLGEVVFFNKGRCSECHHIDGNRIIFPGNDSSVVTGGYGVTNESHNIGLNTVYADNGVGAFTGNSLEDGQFMIPALLNVEYTAPYMHDGRFKTLEEVVEHYNSGIQPHPNLDIKLREVPVNQFPLKYDVNNNGVLEPAEIASIPPMRLNLTPSEKQGLVDFLKTLSDPSILSDASFSNPFVRK